MEIADISVSKSMSAFIARRSASEVTAGIGKKHLFIHAYIYIATYLYI